MDDTKHSISISDKLYQSIKRYCQLNDLKLNTFVEGLLLKAFNVEKYGETPFQNIEPVPVAQPIKVVDDYAEQLEAAKNKPLKPAILPPEINDKIESGEALELVEVQPMEPPTIPTPEKRKKKVTRLN